jgi:hypothetical protein
VQFVQRLGPLGAVVGVERVVAAQPGVDVGEVRAVVEVRPAERPQPLARGDAAVLLLRGPAGEQAVKDVKTRP